MSRSAPGFARAFAGHWRITEMDEWDEIDLLGSARITFTGKDGGELIFLAVEVDLDVRYSARTASPAPSSPGRASTTAAPPAAAVGPP